MERDRTNRTGWTSWTGGTDGTARGKCGPPFRRPLNTVKRIWLWMGGEKREFRRQNTGDRMRNTDEGGWTRENVE